MFAKLVEAQQVAECELGLHAVEVRLRARFRQLAEGERVFDVFTVRLVGCFELFFLLYHLFLEPARRGLIAATLPPSGVGHFDEAGGLESLGIGFEQEIVFVLVLVFIGQDYGTSIESMFQGVHGGDLAAFGGDRSVGFGTVGTGGNRVFV